jgi:murein DD-endopeptidase MepM/ murein hydrolase activator NlpD
MKRAVTLALLVPGCVGPAPAPPSRVAIARAPVQPVSSRLTIEGAAIQGALVHGQASPGTRALSVDGRDVALAPDGRFVIGIDRDAGASARIVEIGDGQSGWTGETVLAVAPRAWPIERVDAPFRAGKSDAEFAAQRPGELAVIQAARTVRSDAQGWRQRFRWPATGRLSGRFGAQRVYRGEPGSYHSGADVAVPTGTPVTAPADGVVVLAAERPYTLEGRVLIVDHGMGVNSALLHLSRIDVGVGDRVRQGQIVGASGATGRVSGPHLHWSVQWLGAKLDPLLVAGAPSG